jgi:signal transduction histidine kinase
MSDTGLSNLRREVEALQRLAMITSATLDMDDMLTNAVRETAELLGCDGAQLWIPDHAIYHLVIHRPSLYGVAREWPDDPRPLDGLGYLVDAYHTGELFTTDEPDCDVGPDCAWLLVCPLNTRNRTLGVLQLTNRRAGPFDVEQAGLVKAIASQIAISLLSTEQIAAEHHRAELLGQINQISQELSATLDPSMLLVIAAQRVHQVFGHQAVFLFLLTPDGQSLQVAASAASASHLDIPPLQELPLGTGVIARAIHSGESQMAHDLRDDDDYPTLYQVRRLQSELIAPLRRAEESIGAICILSNDLTAFNEVERDALEMIAVQVSISLENAQFYKQAQRRLLEQSIVHQVGQDLAAILNYRELSEAIVQRMNRALHTTGCLVAFYEQEQGAVRVAADYHDPNREFPNTLRTAGDYLPLDERHAMSEAIRTSQPVTAYSDDPATPDVERALLKQLDVSCQLIIPMVAGDRVLGVVDWIDDHPGRRFSDEDVQLARTLVAQATVAVDNALLFRELETRAQELAEAHQLRSQFLATISHELRTPMNSIIGFTETLIDGLYGPLSEQQTNRLDRIRQNAYNLLSLIDDLLDLSRIEAGRMKMHLEIISVRNVILTAAQTIESTATDKGLSLALDLDEDLPRVQADPERLHQVIINLLSNAVKFTHQGVIRVQSHQVDRQGRPFVQTSVADTGIGISATDQTIIFDEFRQVDGSSTRAYGGTGMGLAITKKLVEHMGGKIWVESEVGKGSTFTFVLPVPQPGSTPAA